MASHKQAQCRLAKWPRHTRQNIPFAPKNKTAKQKVPVMTMDATEKQNKPHVPTNAIMAPSH